MKKKIMEMSWWICYQTRTRAQGKTGSRFFPVSYGYMNTVTKPFRLAWHLALQNQGKK